MSKNLFDILPADFYKPLVSKYRRIYADTILLIFNTFKSEILDVLQVMLSMGIKLEQEAVCH